MSYPSRKFWTVSLTILAILGLLTGMLLPFRNLNKAQAASPKAGTTPYITGPFTNQTINPTVYRGDLRDLPQLPPSGGGEVPAPRSNKQLTKVISSTQPHGLTRWRNNRLLRGKCQIQSQILMAFT